jgi:flagellar biosynthesis GTPase FlhF
MASDDDKQEEEEFVDLPSEVEGDASEVGNTSAQENFEKLNKAVKESSKENSKKNNKEDKKKEKEEKKKEDNKQEKKRKRKKEEKKRRKRTPSSSPPPSSSSSSSSSSSDNGDDDDEYYGTRIPKRTIKPKPKSRSDYRSVSFNYDSLDTKSKDDVTIAVGKLPQFDGTNFAKWKHMMKAYLTGFSLELWNIVCVGFDDHEDFGNLTPRDRRNIRRNAQATSILLSALNAQEYNRVSGLEISKEIWDILYISHEGVDKVKKSKINILMAELNRFTIFDGEGPQEMFDRLMVIVGKIRGLGGDELNDHFVVKVMLEAFAPRNPTLVT